MWLDSDGCDCDCVDVGEAMVLALGGKNNTMRGFLRFGPSASGYIRIEARWTSSALMADQRSRRNFGI